MQKNCRQCSTAFEITEDDLSFYDRVSPVFNGKKESIPAPGLCPDCRFRERLAWRAELHVFQRKSDLSGASILSYFPPEAPCKVFSLLEWYEDTWNGLDSGRPFDFSRPFFPQFQELTRVVPLPAASVDYSENSEYVNSASWNKNCYLIAGANHNEDCYYGNFINNSRSCVDCNFIDHCEICYECIDCAKCYNLRYSQDCSNCSDSSFLFSCRNCNHCFGSVNLAGKQYVFFNEALSKDEYEKRLKSVELRRRSKVEESEKFFRIHRLKFPHRSIIGEMNEDVSGNVILRSRNAHDCYDVSDLEDCRFCAWLHHGKHCYDCYAWGFTAEESYANMEVGADSYHVLFSLMIYNGTNVYYSWNCRSSCKDVFGCVSLKRNQYCILNKQYSKEEYESLVPKIIEHMRKTGEWGEFFPYAICPLAYNQTIANDYFPLSREEAQALGARWKDEVSSPPPKDTVEILDLIDDASEGICEKTLCCEVSGKPFKIIPQEYRFYKEHGIPLPGRGFFARHEARLKKRNPRKLWNRECAKCRKPIETSYCPDRPEIVYCENCYLKEVY